MLRASRPFLLAVAFCLALACDVSLENKGPGANAALQVTAGNTIVWPGACKTLGVSLTGMRAGATLDVTVTTTSGALYSDPTCETPLTTISFDDNTTASFYLKTAAGAAMLSAAGTGISTATFALTAATPTATVVLGQADYDAIDPNGAGGIPADNTIYGPRAAASDGVHLAIADTDNHRVLLWATLPTATNAPAQLVLGQADFTSSLANQGATATASTLSQPTQAIFVGSKLIVADSGNHRVLIWNSFPVISAQAADVVLGQPDTLGETPNNPTLGASSMYTPLGVASDGTQLAVTDSGNHRVLLWTTIPTSDGTAANYVLGQADFTVNTLLAPSGTATSRNFSAPNYAVFADGAFAVADPPANRVLVWGVVPTASNEAAIAVLGQSSMSGTTPNFGGRSARTLSNPSGLAWNDRYLAISDTGNARVLVFNGMPTITATEASAVLGATSMTAAGIGGGATGFTTAYAAGFSVDALWIPVLDQNRVLRFLLP